MKFLTREDAIEWCSLRGVVCVQDKPIVTLRLANPCGKPIAIRRPSLIGDAISVSLVLTQAEGFETAGEFLLLLADWNMWSEQFDALAFSLIQGIRAKSSELRSLDEIPGHVCPNSELPDLQALLFAVIAFQWDAYLVPDTGKFLIRISHDDWLCVWANSVDGRNAMKSLLEQWPTIDVNFV